MSWRAVIAALGVMIIAVLGVLELTLLLYSNRDGFTQLIASLYLLIASLYSNGFIEWIALLIDWIALL